MGGIAVVNPDREDGKVTLITRYGAGKVEECLPAQIKAVQESGHPVIWISDPMHGKCVLPPSFSPPLPSLVYILLTRTRTCTGRKRQRQHADVRVGAQDAQLRDDHQRADVRDPDPRRVRLAPGRREPRVHGRARGRRVQRDGVPGRQHEAQRGPAPAKVPVVLRPEAQLRAVAW